MTRGLAVVLRHPLLLCLLLSTLLTLLLPNSTVIHAAHHSLLRVRHFLRILLRIAGHVLAVAGLRLRLPLRLLRRLRMPIPHGSTVGWVVGLRGWLCSPSSRQIA